MVRDGDKIAIDVAGRKLDLLVSEDEMARRRAEWKKPVASFGRGYGALYLERVTQADKGCDFDFLSEHLAVAEPEIH